MSSAQPFHLMLNVCVIGAGGHSVGYHLPALAHFRSLRGNLHLAAICDVDEARAAAAAREFGFDRSFGALEAMLAETKPDVCLVLTPSSITARVVRQLIPTGAALLIEKPLGATVEEAQELVETLAASSTRAMVSMNRRFDPMITAALGWVGNRRTQLIHATMARVHRPEPAFVTETGVHLIDVVAHIGGAVNGLVSHPRVMQGATWWTIELTFASGTRALLEIQPTAGRNAERIAVFGEDFAAEARTVEYDDGRWCAWERGQSVKQESIAPNTRPFIANGTYAETCAFLDSAARHQAFTPCPAEVLASMQICHGIH